ncbi:hypothetical protein [Actinoallomurus rhizosphaericola]|uniref:hypothetical protein n=1 Tax=Actinoallomurus rhizosphaericola TaxID=2952536 RepID=UPI00209097D6|nr:hypothetical protein [Actinoallomurus rhizosphaericola]MCO5994089.1 hypothetical protein [Actinoallomurus rhizosphaericola]
MGLPRLPEPFHRVYSPPEAPRAKSRRPRTQGVVVAAFVVVALGVAAAAVFVFGRGGARPASAPPRSRPAPTGSRAADAPPTAVRPAVLAALPQACSILPADTVRRLVPTAAPKIDKMGAETAGVCKYSMTDGSRYRAVQVDARAFLPKYMHDQATGMTVWSYEAQWRQAEKDRTADTSTLRRIGGLGDAAFERYWVDRDVRIAVGEATVRYRNVILRVQYTEEQPAAGDRSASEQRSLANAIAAARAGLASLR